MKQFLLTLVIAFGLTQTTQAQINYCDSTQQMTYTTGNYYVYEVALGMGGNSLQEYWMAPLYVWTTTPNLITGGVDVWEDSCFSGPCTHTVFNEYNEDTITTCISYHYETLNVIDTLECCIEHYWNGVAWVRSTSMTVGIEEYIANQIADNKIYDMLGRELTEIPVGTMYIRNQKLYISK